MNDQRRREIIAAWHLAPLGPKEFAQYYKKSLINRTSDFPPAFTLSLSQIERVVRDSVDYAKFAEKSHGLWKSYIPERFYEAALYNGSQVVRNIFVREIIFRK